MEGNEIDGCMYYMLTLITVALFFAFLIYVIFFAR